MLVSSTNAVAQTLAAATEALTPEPLAFVDSTVAVNNLYVPRPERYEDGLRVRSPSETLERRLLSSALPAKVFLSGHVGSGKSTEIRRLAAQPTIQKAFTPIVLAIEEAYRVHLDIAQLLFLMADALYRHAAEHKLLSSENAWAEPLKELNRRIFGDSGLKLTAGSTSVEVNALFFKLRQDLKLEENRRRQFRHLGENNLTILLDLFRGLDLDVRKNLVLKGDSRPPLLLIDDLDKVREPTAQDDIFRNNLPILLDPPVPVLYTVPTGVAFDRCPPALRQARVHLYPVPVLKKQVPGNPVFDPELCFNEVGLPFLEAVLRSRVAPGLFDAAAIRKAAVYSGGVLRTFFWLLRSGVDVAQANDLPVVDGRIMNVAIKNERLNESQSLRSTHYKALAEVHNSNDLSPGIDGSYLDYSYVIECYNDKVWYAANPVLWSLLKP
ncbi:MAG: hypothetical protein IPK82_36385 [Polyangiaceae bacterium]|nr:hypothetical protein [Polyangiaceae bacterium]